MLCRNVLIYFNDETARAGGRSARRRGSAAGGALLVGVSESLLRFGTELVCEEQAGVFLYRKAS